VLLDTRTIRGAPREKASIEKADRMVSGYTTSWACVCGAGWFTRRVLIVAARCVCDAHRTATLR
jgi:hypothetical protein